VWLSLAGGFRGLSPRRVLALDILPSLTGGDFRLGKHWDLEEI
jgi:hypothetical protein